MQYYYIMIKKNPIMLTTLHDADIQFIAFICLFKSIWIQQCNSSKFYGIKWKNYSKLMIRQEDKMGKAYGATNTPISNIFGIAT